MKTFFLICFIVLSGKFYSQDMLGLSGLPAYSSSNNKELERAGSTILFSGVNITIDTFGAFNFNNTKKKSNAGFGIITGAAQITNGIIFNEKEEDLKTVDISLGAATVIFNSIRLFSKQKKETDAKLSLAPVFLKAPFYGKITGLSLKLKF